ncbi:beta-lactamase family protein [Pandoraea nosoerga]|uniref:Penicillin-binding protein, beta-lactamase class C n=1 Tax=Pandoraea nosoerga TaxID=2508296 RepID=A0A5E4UUA2_9BURK|nr:serine hydrolase domain-containing protein [Pandoraea nosoerga]MBN4666553.1 beta-lactamase family protein [Pandoraea nosoerga]MBN4674204.1 beta-lactamase family protein [Pandoraea nosoerga]MBN4679862.1 beta-lactamase family protein [Pandoraea nosoerga]MBN4744423.1 beta-lactamase family protein [Pandoraea nosoerga]VVE03508.1 penicillin-binding protein, beta-lactamase class C [Pandoraea nosoerga]
MNVARHSRSAGARLTTQFALRRNSHAVARALGNAGAPLRRGVLTLLLGIAALTGANRSIAQTAASPASSANAVSSTANVVVAMPPSGPATPITPAVPIGQATLAQGVAQLKERYNLSHVWLRTESDSGAALEAATAGDEAQQLLPVASLSKSVTAIGIALLVQRGQLSLDARLGDLLEAYANQHGKPLDPSLRDLTVRRLLAHRAGLATNGFNDPVNGLFSGLAIRRVGGGADFFNYLDAGDAGHSTGKSDFVYSNVSYLLLGMVIEAVSGQDYKTFCETQIFAPLGVADAKLPDNWRLLAPFAGWQMSTGALLKVWRVFDVRRPTLLTEKTLRTLLLDRQSGPINADRDVYYTLGVFLLAGAGERSYRISHDGIADFFRTQSTYYTVVEKTVPGDSWALVVSPIPSRGQFGAIQRDVRKMIRQARLIP